ncbi:MAG TPA: methyltransferase domain-containing protein [Solirubrobacteraceae bacterium]
MTFNVSADSYDGFMGRYSRPLAAQTADLAGVAAGQRVLDVGCGPGALTAELVARLGPGAVAAVEPSEQFVAAARERLPGVAVTRAAAERLPFADAEFDAALAQLVVHFMKDPPAGVREMRRVTRPGGVVAACVWDHGGGRGPLSVYWQAVNELDPAAEDESERTGSRGGDLAELLSGAGLDDVSETELQVDVVHATFEEWWAPFTTGVGPAGSYVAGLDPERRTRLRERCRELYGEPPFTLTAIAWAARGVVP